MMIRTTPSPSAVLRTALGTLAMLAGAAQAQTTVFSDSFDNGSVAGWSVSSSANVTVPVVAVRTDSFVSGPGSMWTYFDAPGGGVGAGWVRASIGFIAPVAGNYTLDLWARSAPCSGCTMRFEVFVDGQSLASDGTAPNAFVARSYSLLNLASGAHTLTLGTSTDAAVGGRFQASFDDVRISTLAPIPEPASAALLAMGLAGMGVALHRRRSAARPL